MKWFKHESTARNSEKIAALEHRAGIEGYGFYFKLLEIVAGLMDASDKCEASFSPTSWARQTNISTKKWLFLAQCCADVGLIEVQSSADVVCVRIPKLLKRRDNHTKNLQVPQAVRVKKVSLDIDKEKDKEEEREKDKEEEREKEHSPDGESPLNSASKKATRLPQGWQPDEATMAWAKRERPDLVLAKTIDNFRDYWLAKPGKDGTKLDWTRTFQRWVRNERQQHQQPKLAVVDSWAGRDI